MRSFTGVALAALSLCLVCDRPVQSASAVRPPEIQRSLDAARDSFVATDYVRARQIYIKALQNFPNMRDFDRASILIGLGNCDLLSRRYSDALRHYEAASELAQGARFVDHQLVIATNKSTVYRRMADTRSALRVMQAVETLIPRSGNSLIVTQLATVNRDIAFPQSLSLYSMALDLAAAKGERREETVIWNQIGTAFEERGQLVEADRAYTEAFRIRLLTGRRNLQASYFYLGRLRWKQGDFHSAIKLLEIARNLAGTPDAQIQLPYIHHALARACYSDGQIGRAFMEFEAAFQAMREWRLQVLPAESFRIASETFSQRIFTDYVDAGMALYSKTSNDTLAARMLEVAEDSRNWLAQQMLVEQKQLPPEYWQTVRLYRTALARSLGSTDSAAIADAEQHRLRLSELEARLGIETEQQNFSHKISEKARSGNALTGLRRKLKPSEVFLSFQSGTDSTYVWAVTADRFEAHRIAGSKELETKVEKFRDALSQRDTEARQLGYALSEAVLGPLSGTVRGKREWILSLDGPLFNLPFAALPEGDGWLGERHALRVSSSALLTQSRPDENVTDGFVAVADPVYNRADSRRVFQDGNSTDELPRLPGTAREAAACAKAWGRDSQARVMTGTDVQRDALVNSVAARPAILHLAAHVVPHPTFPDQVLVALGLQQSGEMEYLTPSDIAFSRMHVGLVTLSGCGSGRGAALPGLGLFGLTRAWLTAGATAVVASHWPIADDSGELLSAMYERLGQTTGRLTTSKVADALQAAQIRMIQSGGWRSDPLYWSAFAVIGKD